MKTIFAMFTLLSGFLAPVILIIYSLINLACDDNYTKMKNII